MVRFLSILLLVLLSGVLAVSQAQAPVEGQEKQRLADGLYSRGLYDLALTEYEELLKAGPPARAGARERPGAVGNEAVLAFRAAESARQLKKPDVASTYYLRTVKADPNSESAQRARYRLAEAAFEDRSFREAGGYLRELLTTRPCPELEAPVRFLLGQVLEADGQSALAVDQYRALLRNTPEDELAGVASLRIAALGTGSLEERREAYRLGAERAGSAAMKVEALWGWAALETSAGNHEAAADLYWELWTQHPNHLRVREGMIYLAWAHLQAERFEKALDLYAKTSESRRQSFPDTWAYLRAVSLQRLERNEEALAAYEALLTTYPESRFRSVAGYEAAALYAAAGDHENVLRYAEEISQVPGREADGLWMLAESARASGKKDVAIEAYTRLIREAPESSPVSDAMYIRALLRMEEAPLVAAQELEAFARQAPEDPRAAEALRVAGEWQAREGNFAKAYTLWEASLNAAEKTDSDLLARTALLAVRLERDSEALQRFEQFLALEIPEEEKAESRYWRGVVLERNGEAEEAAASYQLALDALPSAAWAGRARLRLGRLYQLAGKEEEALNAFLPLAKSETSGTLPDSLLLWLIDVAGEAERWAAQRDLAHALQRAGRPASVQELGAYAEGRAGLKLNRIPSAIRAFQKGLAFESESLDSAEAALLLGDALLQVNRADEALSTFERAASLGSSLEEGRIQAEALAGLGRTEQQRENWEAAGRHFLSVSVLFDDPELIPDCLQAAAAAFERAGQPERAAAARRDLQRRYHRALQTASTPEPKETP